MNKLMVNEIEEVNEFGKNPDNEDFKIKDIDMANWGFRKVAALKKQVEENNRIADAEIERINSWRDKENKSALDSISYFEYLLKEFYATLRAENNKAKVNTPYGKITVRKAHKWEYDEEQLMDWLKENNWELIKVKKEINKAELKKIYKNGIDSESGEVIPGITITEEENISIVVEGGK